jgi:phage terminase large subunit
MPTPNLTTITFEPTVPQYKAFKALADDKTVEVGFGGGAGGGKSLLGCFWLLSMCLAYPNSRWLMGRKELINLKRTTLKTFFEVCANHGLEGEKQFHLNNQTNTITFSNGSEILLFDLSYQPSDPLYQRLGSLELTGAFVDESAEVDYKALDILLTRVGRWKNREFGLKPKLLETFNPDKGHVYFRYYKPWKAETLPSHRNFFRALPTDNPHLSKDYITQLENADPTTRERLLYGNFEYDDDPTALMDFDSIQDLFTNVGEPGQPAIIADIARFGNDRTVISVWNGYKVTEWLIRNGIDTQASAHLINELAVSHRVPRSRIVIDSDGVGGGVADALPGCKQFIANASPIVGATEVSNYANIKAQCGYLLAEKVKDRVIAVAASDEIKEQLVQELEQIKAAEPDKERKLRLVAKDEVKKRINRSPDLSDCMLMRMFLELTPTNKNPVTQYRPKMTHYGNRLKAR